MTIVQWRRTCTRESSHHLQQKHGEHGKKHQDTHVAKDGEGWPHPSGRYNRLSPPGYTSRNLRKPDGCPYYTSHLPRCKPLESYHLPPLPGQHSPHWPVIPAKNAPYNRATACAQLLGDWPMYLFVLIYPLVGGPIYTHPPPRLCLAKKRQYIIAQLMYLPLWDFSLWRWLLI